MNIAVHDVRNLHAYVGSGHRGEPERLASAAYRIYAPIISEDLREWMDSETSMHAAGLIAEWDCEHRAWVDLKGSLSLSDIHNLASQALPPGADHIWKRCAADLHPVVTLIAIWNAETSFNWGAVHPAGRDSLHLINAVDVVAGTEQLALMALRGTLPTEEIAEMWSSDAQLSIHGYSRGGGWASRQAMLMPDALWSIVETRIGEAGDEIAAWLASELQHLNNRLEEGQWALAQNHPVLMDVSGTPLECSEEGAQEALEAAWNQSGKAEPRTERQQAAWSHYRRRTHRKMLRLKARHLRWMSEYPDHPLSGQTDPAPELTRLLGWPGSQERHAPI